MLIFRSDGGRVVKLTCVTWRMCVSSFLDPGGRAQLARCAPPCCYKCDQWLHHLAGEDRWGMGQVPSAYSLVSRLERSRRCTFPTSWRNKWNEYLIDHFLRLNSLLHSNLLSWIQGTICGLRKMKVGAQHTGNTQQVPHDSKKKRFSVRILPARFFFFSVA